MRRKDKAAKRQITSAQRVLDLPEIVHADVPHIEMQGNREAVVDGCRGVLEYEEDKIKLNAGMCVLLFRGSDLTIKTYSDSLTEITGEIIAVEFEN